MKKLCFIILCLFFIAPTSAQTKISEENIFIEIKKTRKIRALSIQWISAHGNILSGKDNKRVQLRLRVKSIDGDKTTFDPNKLYFVNDEYMSRFAVADANYARLLETKVFRRLQDKESKKSAYNAGYDPSVPNIFYDYPYKKYKDIPLCLDFGTKRKPNVHTLYFEPNTIKNNPLDVYFLLPNEVKKGRIYYGNTFIQDITFR